MFSCVDLDVAIMRSYGIEMRCDLGRRDKVRRHEPLTRKVLHGLLIEYPALLVVPLIRSTDARRVAVEGRGTLGVQLRL